MVYIEPVRLNLGCYTSYLSDWVNLDIDKTLKVDVFADLNQHLPFRDETISEIRLAHVLEHLSFIQGEKLLAEIYRVLVKNGLLRISVPNLKYLAQLIVDDKLHECVQPDPYVILYGSPELGDYQLHRAGYTPETLKEALSRFRDVEEEFVWHEIRLKARK